MKTLKEARVGDRVRVVKLYGEGGVKRRMMDMGLTKGVEQEANSQWKYKCVRSRPWEIRWR